MPNPLDARLPRSPAPTGLQFPSIRKPVSAPYTGPQPSDPTAPVSTTGVSAPYTGPQPTMPYTIPGTSVSLPYTGPQPTMPYPAPTAPTGISAPYTGIQPSDPYPAVPVATGIGMPYTGPQPIDPTAPAAPYNTGIVPPNFPLGSQAPAGTAAGGNPAEVGQNTLPATPNPSNFGPAQTVQGMLDYFLNGAYARNAYQRGVEQAGSRGLINSTIAGGNAERAALESVQPFVQQGMGLLGDRENRAFQGQENQLERMFRAQLQNDSVLQQNWLQTNQFNNQFNAQLSLLPVQNAMQMLNMITQLGAQDPEVHTPQVMSGFTNFFNNTMLTLLGQYFPNRVNTVPAQGGTP